MCGITDFKTSVFKAEIELPWQAVNRLSCTPCVKTDLSREVHFDLSVGQHYCGLAGYPGHSKF